MKTILITGANRGIGLEFVKQYATDGHRIIACCRKPTEAINLIQLAGVNKSIQIHPCDITDLDSIAGLYETIKNEKIDILIGNAGIQGVARQRFDQMSVDTLMQVFKINVCGTLMVYQKLLNLVLNSQDKLIVTISSKVGSITENEAGMAYSYRASKAALNATMKSLSIDYKDQGLRVVVFHPGHVKTDMGGENAPITVEDSISGMKNIIKDLKTTGCFYDNFGETIAW